VATEPGQHLQCAAMELPIDLDTNLDIDIERLEWLQRDELR
jgi:hypothetical protein